MFKINTWTTLTLLEHMEDKNPETDYGPWLLVSRWRGGTHGRGGGARASRLTNGVVADPSSEIDVARGAAPRSLRGGRAFVPSGQQPPSHVSPTVAAAISQAPALYDQSNPSHLLSLPRSTFQLIRLSPKVRLCLIPAPCRLARSIKSHPFTYP